MSRIAILCITALLAGCAGWGPPSIQDDPLYYSMQATRLWDGCTTLGVSDDSTLRETNPLLGDNPSDGEVIAHVAGGMLIQHLVYKAFQKWSPGSERWIAGGFTAVNSTVALRNHDKGASCP